MTSFDTTVFPTSIQKLSELVRNGSPIPSEAVIQALKCAAHPLGAGRYIERPEDISALFRCMTFTQVQLDEISALAGEAADLVYKNEIHQSGLPKSGFGFSGSERVLEMLAYQWIQLTAQELKGHGNFIRPVANEIDTLTLPAARTSE